MNFDAWWIEASQSWTAIVRFCPVVDRNDFVAGALLGIVVGLGIAVLVPVSKADLFSVLVGCLVGIAIGWLACVCVAYIRLKLKP